MVALKSRFRVMRRGFVLPMSLVATFITLMIVGASATYCTTHLRTSQEYLNRTRCRLAAQSAIERSKIAISSHVLKIADVTSENYGGKFADLLNDLRTGELKAMTERMHQDDPNLTVTLDLQPGQESDVSRIVATAEYLVDGRKTSLTRQECIRVPLSESDIFRYAYFVNGDGHLISKYLTVNGDVRSNGDFYLSGINLNGRAFATNSVHFSANSSAVNELFDGRFVTAYDAEHYNEKFRSEPYSRARPTDPISKNGQAWTGGYWAAKAKIGWSALTTILSTLAGAVGISNTERGEYPLVDTSLLGFGLVKVNTLNKVTASNGQEDGHFANQSPILALPQIVWTKTADKDMTLDDCISHSVSATTPKGSSGGSLVCSNCFVNADGEIEQFSVKLKMATQQITETTTETTVNRHRNARPAEEIGRVETWERAAEYGGKVGGVYPPNSVPMYEYEVWRYGAGEAPNGWKVRDGAGYVQKDPSKDKAFGPYGGGLAIIDAELSKVINAKRLEEVRSYLSGGQGWTAEGNMAREVSKNILGQSRQYLINPKAVGYVMFEYDRSGVRLTYHYTKNNSYSDEEAEVVPSGDNLPIYKFILATEYNGLTVEEQSKWEKITNLDGTVFSDDKGHVVFEDDFLNTLTLIERGYYAQPFEDEFSRLGWTKGGLTGAYRSMIAYGYASHSHNYTGSIFARQYHVTVNSITWINNDKKDTAEEKMLKDYLIPVYEYKKDLAWYDDLASYYPVTSVLGGLSSASELEFACLFKSADLQQVANHFANTHEGVDAVDVTDLFDETGGWAPVTSGYYSRKAKGYYAVDLTSIDSHDKVQYSFIHSTDVQKAIEKIKKTETQYTDPVEAVDAPTDHRVETRATTNQSAKVTVCRELRRIFVKQGNRIDTDTRYLTSQNLNKDPDMVLTRNDDGTSKEVLGSGQTTAALRPFRAEAVSSSVSDPTVVESHEVTSSKDWDVISTDVRTTTTVMTKSCNCNSMCTVDKGAVILIGTWDFPITIDGPVVFDSDVLIRGFVTGRGTIYSGRNIHIIGDICYKNPPFWPYNNGAEPVTNGKDLLMLVSRGSIVVGNYVCDPLWVGENGKSGLLHGNYINATKNVNSSVDKRKYTMKNYTATDSAHGYQKVQVSFSGTTETVTLTAVPVKYYESVVGDYVFKTALNSVRRQPDEERALKLFGSSCSFSQYWDCNVGEAGNEALFMPTVACQAGTIEYFINGHDPDDSDWNEADRVGPTGKRFVGTFWDATAKQYTSHFQQVCRNAFLTSVSSQKPAVENISALNAVLYSSEGIYGVVGGNYTPCTINGAIIAQEEALLPFARDRWILWLEKSKDLAITINWDIRLNLKSADSIKNGEGVNNSGFENPISAEGVEIPGEPRTIFWQEVPDSFNKEHLAD